MSPRALHAVPELRQRRLHRLLFVVLGGSAYAAPRSQAGRCGTGRSRRRHQRPLAAQARLPPRRAAARAGRPAGPRGAAGAPGAAAPAPAPVVHQPAGRIALPGITGAGPGGTITVRAISWSSKMTGYDITTNIGSPKAEWGDVEITKAPDRSSTALWKLAATGQELASAKLQLIAPGVGAAYTTYAFKSVRVKGFSTQGSGAQREETVRLSFDSALAGNPASSFDPAAPLAPSSLPRVGRMKVGDIAGETDLVLDAWQLANPNAPVGGGGGGGPADFGPFTVSRPVGATSPALLARFASGKHIQTVTIKLLQPGSTTVYSTYVLTHALGRRVRSLRRRAAPSSASASTTPGSSRRCPCPAASRCAPAGTAS